MTQNVSIGVCWVGDDYTFDVSFSDSESLGLFHKYFFIDLEEILPFHSWFPRKATKKNYDISIFK
jgi:hypothetical protein